MIKPNGSLQKIFLSNFTLVCYKDMHTSTHGYKAIQPYPSQVIYRCPGLPTHTNPPIHKPRSVFGPQRIGI